MHVDNSNTGSFLSMAQVANRLGVSKRTVERERERGRLQAFRIGHQYRVSPEQMDAYMKKAGRV